jgi:DNA-binding MarR family transcriptional regulator
MSATDKAKAELQKALKAAKSDAAEAQKEVEKIEKALASLGGVATRRARSVAGRKRGRPAGKRPAKKGGRQDQVLAYIKKHPGTSSGEIAKALKMNPSAVSQILTKLNKEKAIKKDGRKISAK